MKIRQEMIQPLNRKGASRGGYILYWMQQSQRAACNPALEYAIGEANRRSLPLVVVFGLTAKYPEANRRHYSFMLQGLLETEKALADRKIHMAVRLAHPPDAALAAGENAAVIVCDRGYLRHQRQWRREVASKAACPVIQVEGDAIHPVETVYHKAAYNARILRLRIDEMIEDFMVPVAANTPRLSSLGIDVAGIPMDSVQGILRKLKLSGSSVGESPVFTGGTAEAEKRFDRFVEASLEVYDRHSNQPQLADVSGMSPYLHFGQVSPLWLAHRIRDVRKEAPEGAAAYLEELVVRRELAINYVHYTEAYDRYEALPAWAQKTLGEHRRDERPERYSQAELEQAKTHDPYWNAAMNEMVHTGFMHNYMRMYWGKKVLEWSETPEAAFERLLGLNNKYFIDGRDPNSYAGVAWIFGLHDRAWKERPIFGKVRYMAATGLERKCDIRAYVRRVERMVSGGDAAPPPEQ